MKKTKILTFITVIIFVQISLFSGINGTTVGMKNKYVHPSLKTLKISYSFSAPEIVNNGDFVNIHIKEANSIRQDVGKPFLPVVLKTLEFPFGTHIVDISCTYPFVKESKLLKKIMPSSNPIYYDKKRNLQIDARCENTLFPDTWYDYSLSAGLNKNKNRVTSLLLYIYPVRYNCSSNTISYIDSVELKITYEEPLQPMFSTNDKYDLLIITYPTFVHALKPLIQHKNSHGIQTKLVTLWEIYRGTYFSVQGRDKPEKIKYFIKNAVESWGITYVMLVGDFRKMPIRYSHLETDTGDEYEELKFISDLYYADIYDSEGNFSSWDSDNNDIFGEWPYPENSSMKDLVDLDPDVYVGRLACKNVVEVRNIVKKIISYEENTCGSSWFNNMIVCGGDTFNNSWENGTDFNEGEEANEKALEYMNDFTPIRLWASLGNLTTSNIGAAINRGAGFLYFAGHGNPRNWATHNNGDYESWTEGFMNRDVLKLSNKNKYPVLMVGGCHNSQFDVNMLNLFRNYTHAMIFSTWVPECWGWVFVKKHNGGAIASIGSTGYGGVNIGDANNNSVPDCIEGADGWFETEFFRQYGQENVSILGEAYGQTVRNYIHNFSIYSNRYDCKIVETHVLFGDPSLRIGGYPD